MKLCDLHAHSVYSDGTDTPQQLIALARGAGLSAVALTDHNTVGGLEEFKAAAQDSGIEAVPGVEISTDFMDKELHILALWVQPEHYEALHHILEEGLREKELSNLDLVAKLDKAGYHLDYPAIKAGTKNGDVNRAHIAVQLKQRGYVASVQEAFEKLLRPDCGYYVPPKRPLAVDMIRHIKSLGAVAVWAHPFLSLKTEERIRSFLTQAVPAGLDAMEVQYSTNDPRQTEISMALVEEFGILPSGGSDHHGLNKPYIHLGVGQGNLQIPLQWCQALSNRQQKCGNIEK